MLLVIHGDDFVTSRNWLNLTVKDPVKLEAGDLTEAGLAQILESQPLFGKPRPLVIYGWPKENFLKILRKNQAIPIYIWVKKKLKAVKFNQKEFPLAKTLWRFLKTLTLQDFHATLKTEPVELIFYWLHRQASSNGNTILLKKLMEIDYEIKSGQSDLSLASRLDLLLLGL